MVGSLDLIFDFFLHNACVSQSGINGTDKAFDYMNSEYLVRLRRKWRGLVHHLVIKTQSREAPDEFLANEQVLRNLPYWIVFE